MIGLALGKEVKEKLGMKTIRIVLALIAVATLASCTPAKSDAQRWKDFSDHERSYGTAQSANMQQITADANGPAAQVISAECIFLQAAQGEASWLSSNPPAPCYADVHGYATRSTSQFVSSFEDALLNNYSASTRATVSGAYDDLKAENAAGVSVNCT